MADEDKKKGSSNEVELDLDKYMALIEKLDEQEDTIKEMKEDEIKQIGELISKVLSDYNNESLLSACKKEVNDLCSRFPIYPNLL